MGTLHALTRAPRHTVRLKRVLIVEDNKEAADMLGSMLVFLGYEVKVAYDSETALEEMAWFQPDAAVWDLMLPGLNGYEAVRRVRRRRDGDKIMLVGLTSNATPEDAMAAIAAGFDRHMKKPVDFAVLLGLLGCA